MAVVATADNIVAMEGEVPKDSTTVLVSVPVKVAHTPAWEYGNQHAAPGVGVQMMLRDSPLERHQQLWFPVLLLVDGLYE